MKLHVRSIAWLLPFFLTACSHKVHRQPVQPIAPTIEPAPQPPPPKVKNPPVEETIPSEPPPHETPVKVRPKPRPPIKKKQKGSAAEQSASTNTPANLPRAANQSPAVSAIGQLSSGAPLGVNKVAEDSITAIERNLNGIARKLSDQEQKTAGQIRGYLKQAKAALSSGDTDGARTLITKATVLLGELAPRSK